MFVYLCSIRIHVHASVCQFVGICVCACVCVYACKRVGLCIISALFVLVRVCDSTAICRVKGTAWYEL